MKTIVPPNFPPGEFHCYFECSQSLSSLFFILPSKLSELLSPDWGSTSAAWSHDHFCLKHCCHFSLIKRVSHCFESQMLETLSLSWNKEPCLTSMRCFEKCAKHLIKRPSLLLLPVHQPLSLSHPSKPNAVTLLGGYTPVWEGSHSLLWGVVREQRLP